MQFRNHLLDALSPAQQAAIQHEISLVDLKMREAVARADERLSTIFFPISAVLSMVALMNDGSGVEVATVGYEGVLGVEALFGAVTSKTEAICQVPGQAYCMPRELFDRHLEDRSFRATMGRYADVLFNFMAQSIACNRLHGLQERCARWLLVMNDRVGAQEFAMTQELLATMLGVHRPAVSVAAGILQQAGCIRYHRGHVTIVDRERLVESSCECYRAIAEQFQTLRPRLTAVEATA